MRKFKVAFYTLMFTYVVLNLCFCLMVIAEYYGIDWVKAIRKDTLNLSFVHLIKAPVLLNIVGMCFLVILWSVERIDIWQLKSTNKKQALQITELKAKLYEKHEEEAVQPTAEADRKTATRSEASEEELLPKTLPSDTEAPTS